MIHGNDQGKDIARLRTEDRIISWFDRCKCFEDIDKVLGIIRDEWRLDERMRTAVAVANMRRHGLRQEQRATQDEMREIESMRRRGKCSVPGKGTKQS